MSIFVRPVSPPSARAAAWAGAALIFWLTCLSGFETAARPGKQTAGERAPASSTAEPWAPADVIEPEQLVKTLADPKAARPEILYVGPAALYKGGHIARAQFIGLTARPEGMIALTRAAEKIAKDREVVIYCGCCPFDVCPNIRPAFTALRDRGFTKVRVLHLPQTFAQDWVKRGYPVEKGA